MAEIDLTGQSTEERQVDLAPSNNPTIAPTSPVLSTASETIAPTRPAVDDVDGWTNYYSNQLRQERQQQDQILQRVLDRAVTANPDQEAEIQRLSESTGVPTVAITNDIEEFRRRAAAARAQMEIAAQYDPVLARQMSDPAFARLAHDDIFNLSNTTRLLRWAQRVGPDVVTQFQAGSLQAGELGMLQSKAQMGTITVEENERLQQLQAEMREMGPSTTWVGEGAKVVGQLSEMIPEAAEFGGYTAVAAGTAAAIAGQMGPQVLAPEEVVTVPAFTIGGFFAGFTAKMGELTYRLESGEAYQNMIDAGVDVGTARYASTGVGLVNAAIEVVGLGIVAKPFKTAVTRLVTEEIAQVLTRPTYAGAFRNFAKTYATVYGTEVAQEMLQELSQIAGEDIARRFSANELQSLFETEEGRQEIADRLVQTFEATAQAMILLAGVGPGANYVMDYRAARQAEQTSQFFDALAQDAANSKVRERNPTAYQTFIAEQTQGTPAETIYIDAEQVQNVLRQNNLTVEDLAKVSPTAAQQLADAANNGGDVQISTAEFAAKLAGSKVGNDLQQHLRLQQDGMSAYEAVQFAKEQEQMRQEAENTLATETAKNEEFGKSAARVRAQMLEQIKATGRYTDAVSRNYADFVRNFVVTQASAMNMMPEAFYEKYMYKVQAQRQAGQELFNQDGTVRTETPQFRQFFGNSILVDQETGAPMVLYHGTADSVNAFDLDNPNRKDTGWLGTGVYLTDSPVAGEMYANQKARSMGPRGQNVMPLYARLENPYYATMEDKARVRAGGREAADQFTADLQAQGYDGVIMQMAPDAREIVVFDPASVKSQFNSGTWSRETTDLLRQAARVDKDGKPVVDGQSKAAENKHGLNPHLRVTSKKKVPAGKKPLFAQTTMNSTAPRQIAAIDEVLERHPNATDSVENWTAMMVDALASNDVPVPPYAFINNLNGTGSVDLLSTLSEGQIADADHGFDNAAGFRDDYINGRITIEDTGRLFLWSFLSRGVSPYTQESLFIDAFDGIGEWITAAADGTLSSRLAEFEAWAKTAAPKGSGQPGAGATHNLNAFGKTFLLKMSEDSGDGTGRSRLQVLHDMMSDPNSTGKQVRRKFLEMGEGVGIDNKVVSFTLLVAGYNDVMVLDRVQIRELWNDGRFDGINLYDGYKVDGKPVAGSMLSSITYGARGLLIYEAIEMGLQKKILDIYTAIGRPEAASVGRYHWETWVASSNQEASHATIDAILAAARGATEPLQGVTAKEGEYGAFAYGARYGRDGEGVPYFLYSVPGFADYKFTVDGFRNFLDQIKVSGNQILPKKFKVTESGNRPWYFREGVSLENLAKLADNLGERYEPDTISNADARAGIDQPVANRLAADRDTAFSQLGRVDAATGLELNPDGTVTVYHHTSARNADIIRRTGQLVSAGEPDVYVTTRPETDTGYGDTAVPVRVRPEQLILDDEFPNGRQDFRISVGRPGGSIKVSVGEYAAELRQGARGGFDPTRLTTILNEGADYSTFLHETGHFFLTVYADIAAMPDAPVQVQQDMQTLLQWFGVKDLDTWNNMSLDEQRQYHEQFAYNFEIYLFEGKAPSIQMQNLFDRFAAFLRQVYTSIRDELNALYKQETGKDLPILTGEVRDVMDRMVASQEQIEMAEQVNNMVPMYQTQEQSGMTDEQWAEYQAMIEDARDQAVTDLTQASVRQLKWLQGARSRILKNLQKEAEGVRKTVAQRVTEQVKAMPVYRALEFFKRGTLDGQPVDVPVKLSIAELESMYGKGSEMMASIKKTLGFGKYGVIGTENAIHPDQAAEILGYPSGYAMVQEMINAAPMKDAINQRIDRTMLEEYGELSDQKAIDRKVEEALHNEARSRFIAAELRFVGKINTPVRVMREAARQAARKILGVKKLKEIKVRDFTTAEGRAAKAANKAQKEGKPKEVIKHKQNQLVQNMLASEAIAMRAEVETGLKGFRKFFKADKKMSKSKDMDLIDAARSILAYYGLGPKGKPPTDFINQLQAYNPELYADLEPLILQAARGGKSYKDLTIDEFRALRDGVEALYFRAARDKQMIIEGRKVEVAQIVSELNARLDEIGEPDVIPGENQAPGKKEKAVRTLQNIRAATRRVESWADATDGPTGPGPFTKYIWRPVRHALDQYRTARNNYIKRYSEMIAQVELPVGKIEAKELGYTFGNENGGIGKAELLGAMLHAGNMSNLRKLLLGRGWGRLAEDGSLDTSRWDAFMERMFSEGIITKNDMDWVQSVWNLTEEMKPLAQKAHHDLYGYYFKEVEASPINTPFGVYQGGYVPAKVDQFLVRDAERNAKMEQLESDFRNSMPSTGMGFTKGRVEYNRPLSLDIRMISKHLDDVVRFAYVQPAISDALRLLRNREFADKLTRMDPTIIEGTLIPWLNRAARQITLEPGMVKATDTFWRAVRNRTGVAIMFANITNAIQQFTGLFPAALKVQGKYLRKQLMQYVGNSTKMAESVAELSPFMADRMQNQIFDIQETINDLVLNPNKYEKVQKWSEKHGYFLQQAFQNMVDVVVWTAKYNEVLENAPAGMTQEQLQKEAIAQSDAAVRLTQDSLAAEDIAAFQVGSPFYKTLIQFSGYFNMLANLNASEYIKIVRDLGVKGNKGKLLMVYVLGFMMPMVLSDAIVRTLGGQWDDEDDDGYMDEVAEWFFGSQIRGLIAGVPAFGPGIAAIGNAFNNKPYDDRMSTSPSVSMLEASTIGVAKTVINIVDPDREVTGKNVRDVLTLLSLITGIPMAVLGRPVGYAVDVERGVVDPTGGVDYARGLITGKASEASR